MTHLLAFAAIIATALADVSQLYGPPQTVYGSPQVSYGVPHLTYGPPKVRSGHSSYDVPQESVTASLFSPTTPASDLLVPLHEAQDFRSLGFSNSPVPFGLSNSFGLNSANLNPVVSSTPSPVNFDSVVSSTASPLSFDSVVSSTPAPGLNLGSVVSSNAAPSQSFKSFGFFNPATFDFTTPAPSFNFNSQVLSTTASPLTFDTVVSSTPAPFHPSSHFLTSTPSPLLNSVVSSTPGPSVISSGDSGLNSVLFNRLAQSFPSLAFNYNDIALATPASFVDSSYEDQDKISKQVYFFDAPEEEVVQPKINVISPPPQKTVKVIFVKAPSQPSASSVKLIAPPLLEEKTVVYVLSKNQDEQQIEIEAGPNQKIPSKPEVYFLKYNNQAEAQAAVNKIQTQGHHEDQVGALDVPHQQFLGSLEKSNIPQPIINYARSKGANQIVPLPGFNTVPLSTGFGFTTSSPLLNSFSTTTLSPIQEFSSAVVPSLPPNARFPFSSNFVVSTPSPVVSTTYMPLPSIPNGEDINQNLINPEVQQNVVDGTEASSNAAPQTVFESSTESRIQLPFATYGPPKEDKK
ncbi:unnamed protein product [Acanthoscelides obtectus]|uniref:DUF243 domain-containing protein n=1 Tax=Acanthoscelides obtectus TaxID=200917 RepID=A0A9P0K6Q7_ACAOB|nr:unnamed protein product [Acanthoscelides obtectus]CAK1655345.1 hypothetical protein AOBTE_LOCUS19147 [Acanthoscelides obtectus]